MYAQSLEMSSTSETEKEGSSGTDVDRLPIDERHRWQLKVMMMIRRDFRVLFGLSFADGCGFFVDRILSQFVDSYSYWIRYPKGNRPLKNLRRLRRCAYCCVISEDGYHLFVGFAHQIIAVWNLVNMEMTDQLSMDAHPRSLDYHSGRLLIGCDNGSIKLWNAFTYHVILQWFVSYKTPVFNARFSDDGSLIVSSSAMDSTIHLWSSKSGECLRVFVGHSDIVRDAWKIGDFVVSVSDDLSLKLWNSEDGSELRSISESNRRSLSINCDRSLLAAVGNDGLSVYSWPEMEKVMSNPIKSDCAIFHPRKSKILAVHPKVTQSIEIFNVSKNKRIHTFQVPWHDRKSFCFSPDGSLLIVLCENRTSWFFHMNRLHKRHLKHSRHSRKD